MINFRRKPEKTPFQWNLANNYMQYQQGRKHYWGVKGKDYGMYQSPSSAPKHLNNQSFQAIQNLKKQHLAYQPYLPTSNSPLPDKIEQHRHSQPDNKGRISLLPNEESYGNLERSRFHLRTEPIENFIVIPPTTKQKKQMKKKHLSLQSKNVEVTNFNMIKRQVSSSLHHQFSINMIPKRQKSTTIDYDKKTIEQMRNQTELDNYRQRIVRVIKKDRKNNPTFCNSMLYPLPCHRYIK